MTPARLRDRLLTRPIAELCREDPLGPAWEGVLYEAQIPGTPPDEAELRRFAAQHHLDLPRHREREVQRALLAEGRRCLISGAPLSSESHTPFALDGATYLSVWTFYAALKLPEGAPERAAAALGALTRRPRCGGRDRFVYAGETIAVGSPAHGALVARATEAKVAAHAHVREALLRTGRARLFMGDAGSGALGRYMPFALMVLRLRLAC